MKRLLAIASVLALAGAMLAGPVAANGNGATVIKADTGCQIIPADWGGPVTLYSGLHSVVNEAGNAKLTCKFDIPEGLEPAKAERYAGFLCGTYLGRTTDSRSVVSPGGNITLQCMVKAND